MVTGGSVASWRQFLSPRGDRAYVLKERPEAHGAPGRVVGDCGGLEVQENKSGRTLAAKHPASCCWLVLEARLVLIQFTEDLVGQHLMFQAGFEDEVDDRVAGEGLQGHQDLLLRH